MIPSKLITKENAKKRLEDRGENFMAIFVSGVKRSAKLGSIKIKKSYI